MRKQVQNGNTLKMTWLVQSQGCNLSLDLLTNSNALSPIVWLVSFSQNSSILPGVYLASEFPHPPPIRRGELSHADKGAFWPVNPGGGRDGAVMFLGGKGTFHSSWAREVLVTEPGDHVDLESLFLATQRRKKVKKNDTRKQEI